MSATPVTRRRVERLHSLRRKMTCETFERTVPFRPGWKREYFGGKAHVRPSWTMVNYDLALEPKPVDPSLEVRGVTEVDAPALRDAFFDSFRLAPDYADYPMAAYRRLTAKYVRGFFGDERGRMSPASAAVVEGERIVAAALVKLPDGGRPLLDCLLARPDRFRRRLATAAASSAVNGLIAGGHRTLVSHAMLANGASMAWHDAFGFRERPNYFAAQSRCSSAQLELERLEKLGLLSDEERKRLEGLVERWGAELRRLDAMPAVDKFGLF